jgi:hypothetical protein
VANIVIADLDGTIALIEHRRHWLDAAKHPELSSDERWRRFFADCVDDQPNWPVIHTLRALRHSASHRRAGYYQIHIFSGRSDEVENETINWLNKYGVPWHCMNMRPAGDFTKDEILKESWIKEYDLSEILCVFDDRSCVVEMWRRQGLTCFQVAPGEF